MIARHVLAVGLILGCLTCIAGANAPAMRPSSEASPYSRWENGPSTDPGYFPIAVWLQNPQHAQAYKEIGINLYIGLWNGPTAEQLTTLREAQMPVIAGQNRYARRLLETDDPLLDIVVGWMHGDEPDNAQPRRGGGYGPPIDPAKIVSDYEQIAAHDPSRPVYLNLGQGVAWDGWHGRGVRTNHPEDYPEYVKGSDIVSFDIYPAASDNEIAGELWRVGQGVQRLRNWAGDDRPVWSFIECTDIHGHGKATPEQVKAMVWMALVNGATGIEYFVHAWNSEGRLISDHQLLRDEPMRQAVAAINQQIHDLAPVLNSPTIEPGMTVISEDEAVPIQAMLKADGPTRYLFTVSTRQTPTSARFSFKGLDGPWRATVLGEDRTIDVTAGTFTDEFDGWATHLYRLERVE